MYCLSLHDLTLKSLHLFLANTGIDPITGRSRPVDLRPRASDSSPEFRIVQDGHDLPALYSATGLDKEPRQAAADLRGNADFCRADHASHRVLGRRAQQAPPMP